MGRVAWLALAVTVAAGPASAQSPPLLRGRDAAPPPGFLGVVLDQGPDGRVVISEVIPDSPAAAGGLRAGDVVTGVSGARVRTPQDLVVVVMGAGPGARMRFEVERGGAAATMEVVLAQRPSGPADASELEGQAAPSIEARQILPRERPGPPETAGRVVVLDFWATWCAPCRFVMPVLEEWHERWCRRGLTVLGVTSESRPVVEAWVRRRGIPYAIGLDPGSRTATRFGVAALPTMVVIDRAGQVRRVNIGADPVEIRRTESLVERLIAEPAPAAP